MTETRTAPPARTRAAVRARVDRLPASMPGRSTSGWWSLGDARMLVHRHEPDGDIRGVVVVLSPPSNEALTTHRTERTLAALLVERGYAVVRTGFTGTGSSTAPADGRPLVARWEDETAAVLRHAAELYGLPAVSVVATRLGATIAHAAARRPDVPVDRAVLLAPVGSGRQYLRAGGQLVGLAAQAGGQPAPRPTEPDGRVATYGPTLDPASAEHLRGYALGEPAPGVAVHVVAGADRPLDRTLRAFVASEGVVHEDVVGLAAVLDRVSGHALVPLDVVDRVVEALTADRSDPVAARHPAPDPVRVAVVDGDHGAEAGRVSGVVVEVVDVDGMPGVLTAPEGGAQQVLVWSPGATEPGDGPSGLWAAMALRLATQGLATVRVDLADSGERTRPDRLVDVYPYDDGRVAELTRAVRWAADRFGGAPDLGGLCSGAWLALAAAARTPVRRLVPVNVEQWTLEPTVIERLDADPLTGAPTDGSPVAAAVVLADEPVPGMAPETAPAPDAGPARLRALRAQVEPHARALLKEHLPYRARVELGRRGVVQAPEPVLDAVSAGGARVRVLLTHRDGSVLTALHGHRALARLHDAGRDVVVEVDSALDHGMVLPYSRERALRFVERALLGEDVVY